MAIKLASADTIKRVTDAATYRTAAAVTAEVVRLSGGKLPCYALEGKRVPFRWVSVGSSCLISRGDAKTWLKWVDVDIDQVERVPADAEAVSTWRVVEA